jgi:hypothetical protein
MRIAIEGKAEMWLTDLKQATDYDMGVISK